MIYGDKLGLPLLTACQLVSCRLRIDRKSTRLNSSHLGISYAVFCLKKKKKKVLSVQMDRNTQFFLVRSKITFLKIEASQAALELRIVRAYSHVVLTRSARIIPMLRR